jgi:hypothetical protein
MQCLAHRRVSIIWLTDGMVFAFPEPFLPVQVRQVVREFSIVLLVGVVAGAALFIGGYYIGLLVIPALVLYVLLSCLFREDTVSRFTDTFKLIFSGEMARRDGERTRFLQVSGNRLVRTNCVGEDRTWHQRDIGDIHMETSSLHEGVLISIVLRDCQGRRSILHDQLLSNLACLPEREEMALIARQLRHALGIREYAEEIPAPDTTGLAHALVEKSVYIHKDTRNDLQRSIG